MLRLNNVFKNISFVVITMTILSCKKDEAIQSKTVLVPVISVNGSKYSVLKPGSSYQDAGATLTDAYGNKSTIQASSSNVDLSKVGVYFINYIYVDEANGFANGFEIINERVVAIASPLANPLDLTGEYLRLGNTMTITKVANGLHLIENVGGVSPSSAPDLYEHKAYLLQTGSTPSSFIMVPVGDAAKIIQKFESISINPGVLKWKIIAATRYGSGLRTFNIKTE